MNILTKCLNKIRLLFFAAWALTALVARAQPVFITENTGLDSALMAGDQTPNDLNLWNKFYWLDPVIKSQNMCEAPVDIAISATSLCSGSALKIQCLIFLDLNGDSVMETVIDSKRMGINGLGWNTIMYNNVANPNYAGGYSREFDERPVLPNRKYGFALQLTVSGNQKTAAVRWNTQQSQSTYNIPELPHGMHKVKWIVTDSCGNEAVLERVFTLKDGKKPEVICPDSLTVAVVLPNTTHHLHEFLISAADNCTPSALLAAGIRRGGSGETSFPSYNGTPLTAVSFTCADCESTQPVDLWVMDKVGNSSICTTYVTVVDSYYVCAIPQELPDGEGTIKTEAQKALEDVSVTLDGVNPFVPTLPQTTLSSSNGYFYFQYLNPSTIYTVTPAKNDGPQNGVSTYDLVQINKHILGTELLNSPYKIIAADVNNNRSLSTYDLVELRKLILGIYAEFPNNTSWRFVDKKYQFPNPANPFQEIWPENIGFTNVQSNLNDLDFIAVKVGDINNSAITNAQAPAEARTIGTLWFEVSPEAGLHLDIGHSVLDIGHCQNIQYPTRNVQCPSFAHDPDKSRDFVRTGDEVSLVFRAAAPVAACQFTLEFPALELQDLMPGPGLTADHFAVFPAEHALTASLDNEAAPAAFTVRFRAQADGRLSQLLAFSDRITRQSAVRLDSVAGSENLDLALRFAGQDAAAGFLLYPNTPNPWTDRTRIGFYLSAPAGLTLRVYDATGRAVWAQQGSFNAGMQQMSLVGADLGGPGVYYYALETPWGQALGRMCRL